MEGQLDAGVLGDRDDLLQEPSDVVPDLLVGHLQRPVDRRVPEVLRGRPDLIVVEAGHLRAAPARRAARGAQAVVADGAPQREAVADDRDAGRSHVLDGLAPARDLLVAARQSQLDLVRPLLGDAGHRPPQARVLDAVADDHQLLEAVVAPLPRQAGLAAHVVGRADLPAEGQDLVGQRSRYRQPHRQPPERAIIASAAADVVQFQARPGAVARSGIRQSRAPCRCRRYT